MADFSIHLLPDRYVKLTWLSNAIGLREKVKTVIHKTFDGFCKIVLGPMKDTIA